MAEKEMTEMDVSRKMRGMIEIISQKQFAGFCINRVEDIKCQNNFECSGCPFYRRRITEN